MVCLYTLYNLYIRTLQALSMLCLACYSLMDGSRETLHMGACILRLLPSKFVCGQCGEMRSFASQWVLGTNEQGGLNLCSSQRLVHTVLLSHVHLHCCLPNMYIPYRHFPHTTSIVIMKERQSAEQSSASWNMKAHLLANSLQSSRPRSLWETQLNWTGAGILGGINWMVRKKVDNETANLEFTSVFGQCLLFWWSSAGHRLERSRVWTCPRFSPWDFLFFSCFPEHTHTHTRSITHYWLPTVF